MWATINLPSSYFIPRLSAQLRATRFRIERVKYASPFNTRYAGQFGDRLHFVHHDGIDGVAGFRIFSDLAAMIPPGRTDAGWPPCPKICSIFSLIR
jgi:hypothetical protein